MMTAFFLRASLTKRCQTNSQTPPQNNNKTKHSKKQNKKP